MKKFEELVKQEIDKYLNLNVGGVYCKVPYIFGSSWMEFWRTGGKGSVEQIKVEAEKLFALYDLVPAEMTEFERYKFLRDKRVGIDCSGLVYNIYDQITKNLFNKPLSNYVVRFAGLIGQIDKLVFSFKRNRRIASYHLTSDLNSFPVKNLKDIRIGDMIKMKSSDPEIGHVAIIYNIDISQDEIIYAHSSFKTKTVGPHLGKIRVTNYDLPIDKQYWEEVSAKGESISTNVSSKEGLGLRRLKIFTETI